MELRITRHNMYTFPVYVKLFKQYPGVREVHAYSKWIYGYFGNSYEDFVEINKIRVNARHFNNWLYRHAEMHPYLEKDMEQFKLSKEAKK